MTAFMEEVIEMERGKGHHKRRGDTTGLDCMTEISDDSRPVKAGVA